jgi:hypothetical protein
MSNPVEREVREITADLQRIDHEEARRLWPRPAGRTFVLAPTAAVARAWCRCSGIRPYGRDTRILSSGGVCGVSVRPEDRVVFFGDVEGRSDYERIVAALTPALVDVGGLDFVERV